MVDSSGGASRDTEIQYLSPMSGAASSGGALSASREKSKASTSTSGPNEQDRDKSSEIDSQQSPQLLVLEITVAGVTDDVIVHYGDQPRDLAVAFAKKHSIGTPGQPSSAIDKIARHVSMCLENFLKNAPAERVIHEALQTRRQRELANASSTSQAPGAHSVIAGEEMGGKKKQVASPSVASESIPRPATKQSGHKHSPDRSPVHSISPQSASSSSRSSSSRSPSGRGAIAARTREAHVTKPVLTPTASPPLNAENSISEPGGVYRSPPLRSPSPRAAIHRPPIQEHLSVSPSRSALHGSSPVRQAKSADTGADSHSTGESLLLKDMEAEAAFELAKTQWDTLLGQQYPPTAPGVLVGSARNSGSTSSHTLESHTELVPQRGRHPGEEASISSATDGSRHTGLRAQQHSGSESATGTAQSSHRGVGAIGQGCTPAARTAERLFREATVLRNKRESLQAHAARRQQQELQDSLFRVERESARLVQQSGWKSGHGSTAVLHRLYEEGLRTVASKREAPDAPPQSYLENWSCARCGTFHRLPASHRIASPVRRPGSVVASGNQPTGTRDSASPGRASPIDSTPSPNGRSPGIRRTKRTAIVFNMQRLPPLVCDTCGFRQGAAAYDTPTTGGLRTTSAELDNMHPRSKRHVHPAHQACVPDETFQPQLPARTVEIIELAQAQAKGVGVTAGSAPMGEYFRLRPDERLHRGVRPVAPSAIKLATVLPTPPPGDQLGTDLDCAAADLPPAPPSVEAAAQRELVKRLAYEAKDRAKEREAQAAALHARDPLTGRPLFHPRIRHTPPSFQRGMTSVSNRRDHYATQARNEEHLEALRREQERKDKDLHHLAEKCTGIRSQKLVEKARMRTENDLFRTLVERWGGPAGHLRLVDVPVEALLPEVAEIVQAVRFEQLRTVDDVASASALDLPTWRHLLLAASDRSASTGDACRLLVPESRLQQQRQVLRLLAQGLSTDSAQIQGLLKPSRAEVAASGNSSAAGTADGLVWREWEQEPLMPYSRAHANAAAAAAAATNPFVPFINPVSARSAGISRAQDARPVEEILQAKGVKTQQELEQARQRILQEEAASLPFAPTVFRPPRALRGVQAKVDAGAPHIAGESLASNEQRRSSPVVRSTKKSSALTLLSHGKSADKLQRAVNIAHSAPPNPVEVVQALKQVAQKPSMAAAAAPASGPATENASLLSSTNGTSNISHYINAPIVMSLPRATAPPLPAEIGAMLVAKALERELGLPATEHVSKEKNV